MNKTLEQLQKEMEIIAGEWNGDESGRLEDRANFAGEIIKKIAEIKELLNELN